MKTRTTQEDRDELRKYFVDLITRDERALPPRHEREKFLLQVLLDCQDAIDRVESLEHRLKDLVGGADALHSSLSSLLKEAQR